MIYLLTFPFLQLAFLLDMQKNLDNEQIRIKCDALYLDIKTGKKLNLFYTFLFLLRRIILAASIVWMGQY